MGIPAGQLPDSTVLHHHLSTREVARLQLSRKQGRYAVRTFSSSVYPGTRKTLQTIAQGFVNRAKRVRRGDEDDL